MAGMTHAQIEDLLRYIGVNDDFRWKNDKINFCCPIHHERHPSCGINSDYVPEDSNLHFQVYHCFACGSKGTLDWFLYQSMPDDFKTLESARIFLKERYHMSFSMSMDTSALNLKRYDDFFIERVTRPTMPRTTLAPFKSGKETYQYFYDRGFTKQTVIDFMIGRDIENETVTIPVFYEDHTLAGVIGRYIDPNRAKNSRYKIYSFQKSSLVFPMDRFKHNSSRDIIIVEGILDAVYLHQLGYTNTVSTMTNSMSKEQAKILRNMGDSFIFMFDNDERGRLAEKVSRKMLGKGVQIKTVEYPEFGKDPCDWSRESIDRMILNAKGILKKPIRRL